MNNLQMIVANCEMYGDKLQELDHKPVNFNNNSILCGRTTILPRENRVGVFLDHSRWMCDKLLEMATECDADDTKEKLKINRWYGCLQGYLMMGGVYSLDDCREHNRT